MTESSAITIFIIFFLIGMFGGHVIALVKIALERRKTKKRLKIDEIITHNFKTIKTKEELWPDRPAAELRTIILEDMKQKGESNER